MSEITYIFAPEHNIYITNNKKFFNRNTKKQIRAGLNRETNE